jgi:hypothetical protein
MDPKTSHISRVYSGAFALRFLIMYCPITIPQNKIEMIPDNPNPSANKYRVTRFRTCPNAS